MIPKFKLRDYVLGLYKEPIKKSIKCACRKRYGNGCEACHGTGNIFVIKKFEWKILHICIQRIIITQGLVVNKIEYTGAHTIFNEQEIFPTYHTAMRERNRRNKCHCHL
jgi:hypothetical protein